MKVRDCFEAGDWGYVVEGGLLNPLLGLRFPEKGKLLFRVDTGFSGPILVTGDVFEFLGLSDIEVPDEMRPNYRTFTGPLTMRSATAIVEINGRQLDTDILTPLVGPSRIMIGFQVLRRLELALLREKACFVAPE